MLTSMNSFMKLRERSLTQAAIVRLRIFGALALVSFPLFTAFKYLGFGNMDSAQGRLPVALIILAIMLPVAFSRLANMIFLSEPQLDEWEVELKRKALSFGYRSIAILLMISVLIASLFVQNMSVSSLMFSYEDVLFVIGNFFWIFVLVPILYTAWAAKPLSDN